MNAPQHARAGFRPGPLSVAVVMTGGTIAKSYSPAKAQLYNFEPKVKDIIAGLRTDDLSFTYIDLLHLDSLDIQDTERAQIAAAIAGSCKNHDAVLVTHGTDSMVRTGEYVCDRMSGFSIPVIFTGAMVPFTVSGSDAVQNVTEALLALRLVPAGVYVVFHNRVLPLPGAQKDIKTLTFEEI
ncbi:MAG: asparaginase [Roseibium sp.]|uniref:asparaginase domain-containing protein n=1 Tax=Roseibium sp. TaxID=1936156 RepID=UPI00261B5E17|nr:asparaginase domain-containing protein [Roseibium sp.]MCV0429747.1 asparaginase [Roseibium sp.]